MSHAKRLTVLEHIEQYRTVLEHIEQYQYRTVLEDIEQYRIVLAHIEQYRTKDLKDDSCVHCTGRDKLNTIRIHSELLILVRHSHTS